VCTVRERKITRERNVTAEEKIDINAISELTYDLRK
jgi:hypothetical protein